MVVNERLGELLDDRGNEGSSEEAVECAHKDTIDFGAVLLTDYINENY